MMHSEKLVSFHVVERENGNNFLTWTYPTISEDLRKFILAKSSDTTVCDYFSARKNNNWIYFRRNENYSIVVVAREFEPNKYKLLCDILAKKFSKTHNPVELVKLYLNLFTNGACSMQENGGVISCDLKNFQPQQNLKDFIRSFDLEIILPFTAILLKRRLLLYNDGRRDLEDSQDLLTITQLVPCRNVHDCLYPCVDSLKELRGLSFFVAGTTDPNLAKEKDLYDLFIDLRNRHVLISPKSEEIMAMTKTHKELATFLMKLAESEMEESEVKGEILRKTGEILSLLKNLGSVESSSGKMVTLSDLKTKNYHPALENFLFNLALAENMMIL